MRNEAHKLLAVIQNYTRDFYPGKSWMVMGDFNKPPEQLRPFLHPHTGLLK